MRKLLGIALIGLTAACMTQMEDEAALTPEAQSELAAALEGRTAGRTAACISSRDLGGNRSIGEQAILFEGRTRGTVYVNRPAAGCPDLRHRYLVTRTPSTQLCRGDIVQVVDQGGNFPVGGCALGDFTPYTR